MTPTCLCRDRLSQAGTANSQTHPSFISFGSQSKHFNMRLKVIPDFGLSTEALMDRQYFFRSKRIESFSRAHQT